MTTATALLERMLAPQPPQSSVSAAHHLRASLTTGLSATADSLNYDFFGNTLNYLNADEANWDAPNVSSIGHNNTTNVSLVNTFALHSSKNVLESAFDDSGCFQFAGFIPSPAIEPVVSQPFLSQNVANNIPCRATVRRQQFPTNIPSIERRYTSELISDDDEVLSSDWRWKEAVRLNNRLQLLENLLQDIQDVVIVSPRPRRLIRIAFLESEIRSHSAVRTTQKYPHLRHRVVPPAPLDMSLCRAQLEKERDAFGPCIEIVVDSDTGSSSSDESFFECTSVAPESEVSPATSCHSVSAEGPVKLAQGISDHLDAISSDSYESRSGSGTDSDGYHCSDSDASSLDGHFEVNDKKLGFLPVPSEKQSFGFTFSDGLATFGGFEHRVYCH